MNTRNNKKAADIILIALLLLISICAFLFVRLTGKQGSAAVVSVEGEVVQRIDLGKDGVYELNGGTNILEVKGGKARMIHADCPDKLCTHMGSIDSDGQAIICLPNKLTVVVQSDSKNADFTL